LPQDIIAAIRRELKQNVDEKTRDIAQRYFKEKIAFYGVKSNIVDKIAGRYFQEIKAEGKMEIFGLCEGLLKSDFNEEAIIAFDWAYRLRSQYQPEDFRTFEDWLKLYVNNWAKCDTLCNHTIGAMVERYPQFVADLKRWATSDNRWFRRAAAVTLIIPAKRGEFLIDIYEICDILLKDPDDLVQKGYGWLLKDTSIRHQEDIFHYVMEHRQVMPRTALRYAIERMPPDLKRQAMTR
jgi:3-methyladenine DNA glycosylase AlkD